MVADHAVRLHFNCQAAVNDVEYHRHISADAPRQPLSSIIDDEGHS